MGKELLRNVAPITARTLERTDQIVPKEQATAEHEFDHAAVGEVVGENHEIVAKYQGGGTRGYVKARARNTQGQIAIAMASEVGGHSGTGWDTSISHAMEHDSGGRATVAIGRKIARNVLGGIPSEERTQSGQILLVEYKGEAKGTQFASIRARARYELREMRKEKEKIKRSLHGQSINHFDPGDNGVIIDFTRAQTELAKAA